MEEQFNSIVDTNETSPQSLKDQRGTFLTVLCILSWVASASTFITSLFNLVGGKQGLQNQIIETEEKLSMADDGFLYDMLDMTIKQLYLTLENFYAIHLSNIIITGIGIYAVYLMYNLKRIGFNIYVFYALVAPFVSYYFVKDIPYSVYGLYFALFISIAFIFMYYKNLNRMTN